MTARALEMYRSVPRYLAARALSARLPSLSAVSAAPLRLVDRPDPRPPGPGWGTVRPRLAGICGSDLATVTGRSSFYFSPLVSLPFVPGHEVVGVLQEDLEDLPAGTRVVLDPVLSCVVRGVAPCAGCAAGQPGRCDRVTVGHICPGLQTGYCADTGGGWSRAFVAHRSQLHPVPDDLDDKRAVLVEPLACAVRAALRTLAESGDRVLVVGAGAVGLLTILALREFTSAGQLLVVAKHRHQAELATRFGASEILSPEGALGGVRRATRAIRLDPDWGSPYLLGGVDVAIDCAGTSASLDTALRTTRAGGRVVLAGLPAAGTGIDLTPLWYRELTLAGTYASGHARVNGHREREFALAMELAGKAPLDGVLSAVYPLEHWRDALDTALGAGRLGAVKVAFDLAGWGRR
ncbi:MAG: zinc-dependent alcohol dehydrogenase [Frankiaceae bacterium]